MTTNRLIALHEVGQSIWLDFIDRTILENGDLARMIREDALTGMTSNPTIFEKALAEGDEYDDQIKSAPPGLTAWDLFELVETTDVRIGLRHLRRDLSGGERRRRVRLDRGVSRRLATTPTPRSRRRSDSGARSTGLT